MTTTTREEIASKAYERFEARGRAHGDDLGDWFAAEAELRSAVTTIERPKTPSKNTAARKAPGRTAARKKK